MKNYQQYHGYQNGSEGNHVNGKNGVNGKGNRQAQPIPQSLVPTPPVTKPTNTAAVPPEIQNLFTQMAVLRSENSRLTTLNEENEKQIAYLTKRANTLIEKGLETETRLRREREALKKTVEELEEKLKEANEEKDKKVEEAKQARRYINRLPGYLRPWKHDSTSDPATDVMSDLDQEQYKHFCASIHDMNSKASEFASSLLPPVHTPLTYKEWEQARAKKRSGWDTVFESAKKSKK